MLLTFLGSTIFFFSCNKITEDADVANALIGHWRFTETSVNLTVDGDDLIQYLTTDLELSESEAKSVSDSIIADVKQNYKGAIFFGTDKVFVLGLTNKEEESGTWSVSADGQTLNLIFENDEKHFQILALTAQVLVLEPMVKNIDVDFDNDGVAETALEITTIVNLFKSSNGGIGG